MSGIAHPVWDTLRRSSMNREAAAPKTDRRLRIQIIAIAVLALLQTIRILAYPLAQDVLAGRESLAWLYPAYVDMFIGITAPFVAFAIWRRTGLAVWTTAIVWFAISITDHLDALTVILNMPGPLPSSFPGGSPSVAAISLVVQVALEGLALLALTRSKMRSHYLG
jgi:hypothetical protein